MAVGDREGRVDHKERPNAERPAATPEGPAPGDRLRDDAQVPDWLVECEMSLLDLKKGELLPPPPSCSSWSSSPAASTRLTRDVDAAHRSRSALCVGIL